MNISRSVFPIVLVVLALLTIPTPRVFASAENQVDQALAASKIWVAQIDAKKYEESYAFTCEALRDKMPADRWVDVLKTLRTPWGTVVGRKQTSHIFKPNGVSGLSGECMVITYDTTFQKEPNYMEEIVLVWEGGKWRGAGYNAGPKPSDDNSAPPPTSSTVTHTEPHVSANPRNPSTP